MRIFFILFLIILSVAVFFQRTKKTQIQTQQSPQEKVSIVAKELDTPWAITFLPNGNILVNERPGRLNEINHKTGNKEAVLDISGVKEIGEGGLLGLALDPDYSKNNFIYLYYTYSGDESQTQNKVVRFVYKNQKLSDEKIILDKIPGAPNHNGGRIKFGPDGNLYVTTGDAGNPSQAQDTGSLAGKILRVINGNVEMYSYGHRNPQGIAWDKDGQLWATEHGKSGVVSGFDELNKIDQGKNYGWPEIEGDEIKDEMVTSVINSGANDTWAPAGLVLNKTSLFFGGLRGSKLYEYKLDSHQLKEHFKNEFGRIRDVVLGPDDMLYITTSNLDGRGIPKVGDDKIIKIQI